MQSISLSSYINEYVGALIGLSLTIFWLLAIQFFDWLGQYVFFQSEYALAAAMIVINTLGGAGVGYLIRKLRENSVTDPLTSAYNRAFFNHESKKHLEIAKRFRSSLSLVILDLDDFKSINDTYGHLEGDRILANTSAKIKSLVRNSDRLFRFGGEEFVLLLPQTDSTGAMNLVERLINRFDNLEKNEVTFSAGIASYPDHGSSIEELLVHADKALYHAKRTKSRVCLAENWTKT